MRYPEITSSLRVFRVQFPAEIVPCAVLVGPQIVNEDAGFGEVILDFTERGAGFGDAEVLGDQVEAVVVGVGFLVSFAILTGVGKRCEGSLPYPTVRKWLSEKIWVSRVSSKEFESQIPQIRRERQNGVAGWNFEVLG